MAMRGAQSRPEQSGQVAPSRAWADNLICYYPLWVAADTRLESPDALLEGPDVLIESLGHRFCLGIEVFRVRMPTPDETCLLRLAPCIPLVQMWDVDYDANGRALQAAEDLYAGDRHEFACPASLRVGT